MRCPPAQTACRESAAAGSPRFLSSAPPRTTFPALAPWPPALPARHTPSPTDRDKAAEAPARAGIASHPYPGTGWASPPSAGCCPFRCRTCRSLRPGRFRGCCDTASATHPNPRKPCTRSPAAPRLSYFAPAPTQSQQSEPPFESGQSRFRSACDSPAAVHPRVAARKRPCGCFAQHPAETGDKSSASSGPHSCQIPAYSALSISTGRSNPGSTSTLSRSIRSALL